MSEPKITREDGPTKGRYVARVDGIDAEAELTYSRAGPKLIIADHTEVPDPYYGGAEGFEEVLDLLEDGCTELVRRLKNGTLLAR